MVKIFKLMVKMIGRFSGIKKLNDYTSKQDITDTTKTGNTQKNFAAEISLIPEPKHHKNGSHFV